jgi:hypothetical protein
MKFVYPAKVAQTEFQDLEFKGMQALAVGNKKEAAACYDKAILTDPSLDTIQRVIKQYRKAGCGGCSDCNRYFHLSCECERFNNGTEEFENYHFGLELMRKKHPKFVKELQQQAVMKAEAQNQQQGTSSRDSPPAYDEYFREQTALLKDSKPNR